MSSSDSDGTGSLFSRFVNAEGGIRLPDGRTIPFVDPSNPIQVGGIIAAITAAVFTELVLGVLRLVQNYFLAYVRVIDGLAEFTVALFDELGVGAEIDVLFQQLNTGFQAFGVFRPIAVVMVSLLTVWVAARLVRAVSREVLG